MGHLFYTELGNLGYIAPDGTYPQPGWGLSNMGPFINMLPLSPPFVWWSSTEYTIGTAGGFNLVSGKQGAPNKEAETRAWAVRDGDVASVPEPATIMLLFSGLIGIVCVSRRKCLPLWK